MNVTVTDDGQLQLTDDDGKVSPPLSIAAVQALAAAIPDAQQASDRAELTALVRSMTGLLSTMPSIVVSQLAVQDGQLTAHLNSEAFDALAAIWGVTPSAPGYMQNGPATIYSP